MSSEAGTHSLKNHFLIAMPSLDQSLFARSLTYICEHNDDGAMGLVINRPLELYWRDVYQQLGIEESRNGDTQVLAGGPVHTDRGFILHPSGAGSWESSLDITSDIRLTTSVDIITALAEGSAPASSLMALGYAGWDSGQLEDELARNLWLYLQADVDTLFDTPAALKLDAAAAKLGVDLAHLSADTGHA